MSVIYPAEIVNVLGTALPVERTYRDGSFDCPHCGYAVVAPALECANPWCPAYPGMPVEAAEGIVLKREVEVAEKAARVRVAELARLRITEEQVRNARAYAALMRKARHLGACECCAAHDFRTGKSEPRMVVHRKPCPRGVGK